jgi:molecular chaperone GrpE
MTENTENKIEEQEILSDEETNAAVDAETPDAEAPIEAIIDEESEWAKLQGELAEMKDKYVRLYAEFDNFRRRSSKERIDLIQTAGESVLKEIVPLLDDFDRANKAFESVTEIEPIKEGIGLIYSKLQRIMATQGVKLIDAKGADFNADFHECITQFPAPTEDLKNKVIDVVENGYMLNEKVIRYAKVVVGS